MLATQKSIAKFPQACLLSLLAFVLAGCGAPKDPALRLYEEAQQADGVELKLNHVNVLMLPVERMEPMVVLSLNLTISNEGEQPFAGTSSELSVHAITQDQRQMLAPYFQAFQNDVIVEPGETVTDTIRFLIQPEQLDKQLILSIHGQQEWIVKLPGDPRGVEQLGQDQPLTFTSPDWAGPEE